VLEEEKR